MLIKRIFDIFMALVGLLLLAPLFLIITLLIKLDSSGPIFFRQERVGLDGKLFGIFKFRTMRPSSELKGQLTIGSDPRITRLGYHLRRYKIDELPQLINVLLGDMSLVGPRPEVPRYVAYYPEKVRETVLSIRPGITDRASIEFKHENAILGKSADPEKTYIHDILPIKLAYYQTYAKERSFFQDIKIIFATLKALV